MSKDGHVTMLRPEVKRPILALRRRFIPVEVISLRGAIKEKPQGRGEERDDCLVLLVAAVVSVCGCSWEVTRSVNGGLT